MIFPTLHAQISSTTGGPLIWLSLPWRREGALYEAYARHYGRLEDGALRLARQDVDDESDVARARSLRRPSVSIRLSATTEFDAESRDDVEGGYLAPLIVERGGRTYRHRAASGVVGGRRPTMRAALRSQAATE